MFVDFSSLNLLCVLLVLSIFHATGNELPKESKIVIIGAGAAGMSALVSLLEKGYTNVRLYEAQDYIGGRIRTLPFSDNVFDAGAQWIHGKIG